MRRASVGDEVGERGQRAEQLNECCRRAAVGLKRPQPRRKRLGRSWVWVVVVGERRARLFGALLPPTTIITHRCALVAFDGA